MTFPPAFTHGPVTAPHAMKGRSRSSCEALGQQAFGQTRNSPAISSIGGIRQAVGTSSLFGKSDTLARDIVEGVGK